MGDDSRRARKVRHGPVRAASSGSDTPATQGFYARPAQTAPAALNDARKRSPCRPPQPVASRCPSQRDRSPLRQYPPWLHARRAPCSLDAPPAARTPRLGHERARRRRLLGVRRPHAGRARPLLADGTPTRPKRSMLNATMLLTHAAAALAGHTGPARRDDRARALVDALCNGPAWVTSPSTGSQGHMPGWRDGLSGGGIQHLVVDTEIVWGLMHAWRARDAARRRRRPDRRPHHLAPSRASSGSWPTLRLNQVNWYVRMYIGRRGGRRRPAEPADQLLQAAAPLRGRRAQADGGRRDRQPRRLLPLPLPARRPTPQVQPRQRRVREHRLRPAGRLPAGARRAGCRRWTRRRADVSALVRARAVRLLDARRLPELGHRPRLQALAPGQEARALAGRAARHAVCASSRRNGPWAKHMLDRSFELFDRWTARDAGCRRRTPSACRRSTTTSPRPCSPPRACRPTPRRRRSSALGAKRSRGAAAAVRLRPRRRPAGGHHARVQHGDRRRQPRRLPVRRHRARPAVRRPAGRRGRRRRAPAGLLRRSSCATRRHDRRRVPAHRTAATRRCSCSRPRAGPAWRPTRTRSGPMRAHSTRCACAGTRREGGISSRPRTASPRPSSRPRGRSSGAGGKQIEVAVPELGQGRPRHRGQRPRRAPRAEARPSLGDVAWFHVESEFTATSSVRRRRHERDRPAAAASSRARRTRADSDDPREGNDDQGEDRAGAHRRGSPRDRRPAALRPKGVEAAFSRSGRTGGLGRDRRGSTGAGVAVSTGAGVAVSTGVAVGVAPAAGVARRAWGSA